MNKPEPWKNKKDKSPVENPVFIQSNSNSITYWKTWVAIAVLLIATMMGWYVVWSLLFIYWIVLSIKNKELFFVERVSLEESPATFWTTVLCWLVLSLYMLWEFLMTAHSLS